MSEFIKPPVLTNEKGNRHATWLELFFDLVFVVAVAALVLNLEKQIDMAAVGMFSLTFLALWWIWVEYSYFTDLYDTRGLLNQCLTLTGMFGVALMAVVIRKQGDNLLNEFTFCYIGLSSLIAFRYGLASYFIKEWRAMSLIFAGAIFTSVLLWTVSLWIAAPYKFIFWIVGIAIQTLVAPYIYLVRKKFPKHESHMPERFGLFTIIVLGEAVAAIVTGLDEVTWNRWSLGCASTCFLIIATVWKLYFYQADDDTVTQAISGKLKLRRRSFIYGYVHYFIYGSITLVGVGLLEAIHGYNEQAHLVTALLLHGGLAIYLLSITWHHWAAPQSLPLKIIVARILGAILSIVLVFLVDIAPPMVLLITQFAILFSVLAYEYGCKGRVESDDTGFEIST